ncbi:shikimate dehydrogenase [Micrococcus porci]|uniref:shikimate dehydrogenase family protein n=1 Tax=Micrococcus porci TaxID=2856555 RepID=UPI001CCD08BF|nr:shikimate dehydrogenase [Micrococcus porci]UBH23787.1 shikimate dehydrogenase [Micrococcus porci]
MAGATFRAAVLGRPIAHSLSPVLHAAAYRALGLDVDYGRADLGEEEVGPWLAARLGAPGSAARPAGPSGGDWLGVSVTMPLKPAVVPLADELSARVRELGVANTLVRDHPDHPGSLLAHNTDVDGIVRALAERGLDAGAGGGAVGILGNGGTATAAVAAASLLRAETVVLGVRDAGRARDVVALADRLGLGVRVEAQDALVRQAADLRAVVATLPPRAADPLADKVPAGVLPPLLDAAYDPWPSAIARAWSAAGGGVASGLSMLLHQGVEQVRLFTERPRRAAGGVEPDWAEVTAAASRALGLPGR